ncbi:MAG: PEP-CTERM sorting domain-containing protein [Chthoniobacteraceae bacterium]|jgi:hypothetical protein
MKTQFGIIVAAWLFTSAFLRADTSFLLVQGDFGDGGSLEESFKWQVNYPTGALTTGQDLLNTVFGQPVLTGSTYTDAFSGTYPVYVATTGSLSVTYIYFADVGGLFPISFTLGGETILQDPTYNPSWIYDVAGGAGAYGSDLNGAPYAAGLWQLSNDGADTRTIANQSYDAWLLGNPNTPDTVDDSSGDDAPTAAEFPNTNSTNFFQSITVVPEPCALLLMLLALPALALRKRKARA